MPAESGWWAERVGAHFAAPRRAEALLAEMLLPPEVLEWPTARLSSGERQRLALARALLLAPRALLLDEPTAALDEDTRGIVEAILRRQLESGVSMLMVTHDPTQAARMAARILRVEAGQVDGGRR